MIIQTQTDLTDVNAQDWDRLAAQHPFMSYAFLHGLDETGCTGRQTGWQPLYLLAMAESSPKGKLLDASSSHTLKGAVACYIKSHSYGEYVFDHGWAEAWHRAGGAYYPKLLNAAPFTPATGPRLLTCPTLSATERRETEAQLARAMVKLGSELGLSSCHILFPEPELMELLRAGGWVIRCGLQYHWFNRGYENYDAFLESLTSRRRKELRKERRRVADCPVGLSLRAGCELSSADWDQFFAFYQDTGARKWGAPYLTREFFEHIGLHMADQIRMVWGQLKDNQEPVCGALNFIGPEALYGRYWGALTSVDHLHFEACYHQAIDCAIATGLSRVEAGAQGEHKLKRGYEPVLTASAHWIYHDGFRDAVRSFVDSEADTLRHACSELRESCGYKNAQEQEIRNQAN